MSCSKLFFEAVASSGPGRPLQHSAVTDSAFNWIIALRFLAGHLKGGFKCILASVLLAGCSRCCIYVSFGRRCTRLLSNLYFSLQLFGLHACFCVVGLGSRILSRGKLARPLSASSAVDGLGEQCLPVVSAACHGLSGAVPDGAVVSVAGLPEHPSVSRVPRRAPCG